MNFKPNSHYLYLVVLANIFPHFLTVPLWAIAMSLTFLVWKMTSEIVAIPVPNRWVIIMFAAIATFFVFNHFDTFLGDEAGVTLLLLMTCLKLFELRTYNDAMFLSYLCYFLLMGLLISSQSMGMTVFMVLDFVLITGLLVSHHVGSNTSAVTSIVQRTGKLTLQAIPLAIVVFIVFPRFSTGLGLRPKEDIGVMGFSDQLKPGSVAKLVASDAVAFRARFAQGEPPTMTDSYWRGTVLEQASGLEWNQRADKAEVSRRKLDFFNDSIVEIYIEPSSQKWIFTLDWPEAVELSAGKDRYLVSQYPGRVFFNKQGFPVRDYYRVYAKTKAEQLSWDQFDLEQNLKTDGIDAPKSLELALQWKKLKLPAEELSNRILTYFAKNNFLYSLSPKPVSSLDQFLFETRAGFCEHYAGAMASLLRLSGVPARVVVGFHGGMPSLLDDYLTVRFQDAHAWVEYFDSEKNTWQRVDPTTVVAPERIMLGGQRYIENIFGRSDKLFGENTVLGKALGQSLIASYFRLKMLTDQVEASWVNFLLKYDYTYQKGLLANLGLGQVPRWVLFGFILLITAFFIYLFSLRLDRLWKKSDFDIRLYEMLCQRLAKKGLVRQKNEGPTEYCERATGALPQQQGFLLSIFDVYVSSRYGGKPMAAHEYNRWSRKLRRRKL